MDDDDYDDEMVSALRYDVQRNRAWAVAQWNRLPLVRVTGLEAAPAEARKKATVIDSSRFSPEELEEVMGCMAL